MRRAVVVAVAVLVSAACTSTRGMPHPPAGASTTSTTMSSCPTSYAAPDPHRPVVDLGFEISARHDHVHGVETLTFTPDLPVAEVVFRLWPNSPRSSHLGGLTVGTASAGPVPGARERGGESARRFTIEPAGALPGHVGTLLRIPLVHRSKAGVRLRAKVAFDLFLPPAGVDRYGHTAATAWWASGFPLLAWERGHGWATEPASGFPSETATSEDMTLERLLVTAPAADTVLATGRRRWVGTLPGGRRGWEFAASTVRDVAVAVGRLRLHRETVDGVPITYGTASDVGIADEWPRIAAWLGPSMTAHMVRFGPFPFPGLTIVSLPGLGQSGIEYPGVILLGDRRYELVVPHELAHQWFYGLVGNNQARDPWLDEAFATYAGSLAADEPGRYADALRLPERVGEPMAYWTGRRDDYTSTVYGKGSAALLKARARAGPAAFDAAVRCYVAANARRIARPADLRAALERLPAAVAVLTDAGAL